MCILHIRLAIVESGLYLAILGMGDGVNDGVVDARGFGDDDRNGRDQRSDFADVSPGAEHADDGEWSPGHRPQGNIDDGHFGDADLGGNLLLVRVAAQRSHVHFLGLLAQFVFVFENSVDDAVVATDDDRHGHKEIENAQHQYVQLVDGALRDIIIRAPAQYIYISDPNDSETLFPRTI